MKLSCILLGHSKKNTYLSVQILLSAEAEDLFIYSKMTSFFASSDKIGLSFVSRMSEVLPPVHKAKLLS